MRFLGSFDNTADAEGSMQAVYDDPPPGLDYVRATTTCSVHGTFEGMLVCPICSPEPWEDWDDAPVIPRVDDEYLPSHLDAGSERFD